jgi:hypothetical protein
MTLQMPGETRKHVRNALRRHARCAEMLTKYGATYVNNLNNDNLLAACEACGIDAAAIVANAPAVRVTPDTPRSGVYPYAPILSEAEPIEPDPEPNASEACEDAAAMPSVTDEATAIRRELASAMVEGNFDAVTARLSGLIADARKPAEIVTVLAGNTDAAPGTARVPPLRGMGQPRRARDRSPVSLAATRDGVSLVRHRAPSAPVVVRPARDREKHVG